jgi:hypothetical protein
MKESNENMKKKNNKISLSDVKTALRDGRFRKMLPKEYDKEITEFLSNPTCPCNIPLYRKILANCRDQLTKYFPNKEIADEKEEVVKMMQNHWTVINCKINELESKLKSLPPGRKQLAIARWQEYATVIVNELDYVY